ncbi:MAG: hypothetical protein F6K58_08800 [Symploca sp. SIO2E9]|nr:hypothetical protein [Symploca sp. SIO2E9]
MFYQGFQAIAAMGYGAAFNSLVQSAVAMATASSMVACAFHPVTIAGGCLLGLAAYLLFGNKKLSILPNRPRLLQSNSAPIPVALNIYYLIKLDK